MILYTVGISKLSVIQYKAERDRISELKIAINEELATCEDFVAYEKSLKEKMKGMEAHDKTEVIDLYIYYLGQHANTVLSNQDRIDLVTTLNPGIIAPDMVEKENIADKIKTLQSLHILTRIKDGDIKNIIDYDYFINEYSGSFTPGYIDVLNLYKDEETNEFISVNTNKVIPGIVTKRLDSIYSSLQKPNIDDAKALLESAYEYYKAVYLGAFDEESIKGEDGKILDEIVESYKTYNPADKELGSLLREIIPMLEKSENELTDEIKEVITHAMGYEHQHDESVMADVPELDVSSTVKETESTEDASTKEETTETLENN